MSVTGFAVAGGSSRRMGRDKALLPWGETDLLGHALALLRQVTADVRILSGPEARYVDRGVPVETDLMDDGGPLAGVLAGLDAVGGRAGLFLAIDLPFVSGGLLARLVALADGFDAVVPVSPRGREPLCALYGPACLAPIRRHVAAGEKSMTGFWPDVRVREVGSTELRAFGDPERLFININEPETYERLRDERP
jgi:molybdopterin-guanine dinucleotide biosynthesis protein A